MASVSHDRSTGLKRVQFINHDGRRPTLYLGQISMKDADAIAVKVEGLVTWKTAGYMAPELAIWMRDLRGPLRDKLVKHGLLAPQQNTALGEYTQSVIDKFAGKQRTRAQLVLARNELVKEFGQKRDMLTVLPSEAENYSNSLIKAKKSKNTALRLIGRSGQFFRRLVNDRVLDRDPFSGIKCSVRANHDRDFFVTQEMSDKVIAACNSTKWRLIFAMARYGGVRVPSELATMLWTDIQWDNSLILVRSPKTAENPNGESRYAPLWHELEVELRRAFEDAPEGSTHVFPDVRENSNLGTTMHKIIERAGLVPWEKTFQNLRSTRETELIAQGHELHVVCGWLGNSATVAAKHYLQAHKSGATAAARAGRPATVPGNPTQNPTHQPAATTVNERRDPNSQNNATRGVAAGCRSLPSGGTSPKNRKYPQGESNPCMQTENLPS